MTYYPLTGYKLDGYDMYGTFKVKVKKILGLHRMLTRKGALSQSWPDADGEEPFTDANDIHFEGNDVTIFCILTADSYADSVAQFTKIKFLCESPNMNTLTVPYTATTFSLMYVGGSDLDYITSKRFANKCICEFYLKFRQTTPVRS